MVPAWLKTIQPSVTDAPTRKKKKQTKPSKKESNDGSNKENANGSGVATNRGNGKATTTDMLSPHSGAGSGDNIKKKNINGIKKTKKPTATRGRNAGLTVVPIGSLLTLSSTCTFVSSLR